MIIWFNCKITDNRFYTAPFYHLKTFSRMDIAKYCFASYAPLMPITSKIIFNLELDENYKNYQEELTNFLTDIFPKDKLVLRFYRINWLPEWIDFYNEIKEIGDPIIWPVGNDDHAFLDSNISTMTALIEQLLLDPHPHAVGGTSHYIESIRMIYRDQNYLTEKKFGRLHTFNSNDSTKLMKLDLFKWYIDKAVKFNYTHLIFRFEMWGWNGMLIDGQAKGAMPTDLIHYMPLKEQCRHYEAYHHVQIGPEICPPLEIPPGFFEKEMIIRYGFNDRDESCININPCVENFKATDPINGTDYKFCLTDIPAFWKGRIKEIRYNYKLDNNALIAARNKYYLALTQVEYLHTRENLYPKPPHEWFNDIMIKPNSIDNAVTLI